jgi:lycopene cyclase domain-containing protein
MKWLYLALDAGTILVPLIFSYHPRIRFHREFRYAFAAILVAAVPFLVWDAIFTYHGVWGFNERYVLGWGRGGLPIEEILFFICIPFACLFTYYCLNKFFTIRLPKTVTTIVVLMLSIGLLATGILHLDRLYTSITCISLGLMLLFMQFVYKRTRLDALLVVWMILLFPFLIVNGVLTGTMLDEPVVWYNDAENLGRRILTIPVEDTAYGFLLFSLVVLIFEKLRKSPL